MTVEMGKRDASVWMRKPVPASCRTAIALAGLWLFATAAPAFVVINEIMYHPPKGKSNLEFVELLNDSPTTWELTGWKFTSGIEFTFPEGSSIPAYGLLVVCANPDAVRRAYNIQNVVGPCGGSLSRAGALIELRNAAGGLIDRVDYKDDAPWPAGADGTGHSLSLVDPTSDNERGESWALSNELGGTPGRENFPKPPCRASVVINEVLFDSAQQTFVELFNLTTATVELSDYALSDDAEVLAKFVIPKGTAIQPRGFRAFTPNEMGFALSPKRRKVFLSASERYVSDAVACRKTDPGQSFGRWPDGSNSWYRMPHPTADAANTVTLQRDVVINEIMYHPWSERVQDEYVELYNRGRSPVDLGGWAFTKGIEFDFAPGTILPPDGYLMVAKNRQALMTKYGITNCVGNFRKHLNGGGDHLILRDALGNVANEVAYCDGGRWPEWADGGGSSLELIDPRQDNRYPSAWAASDESGKAQWTHIEYSKPNRNGQSRFELFLLEKGVVLIDDLELRAGNRNYIWNGTFDKDTQRWMIGGTHKYSARYTADSHSGGACLRVVSVGGGRPGPNSLRELTSGTLQTSQTYTVSYWAKWQAGNNRLCTRTHNNGVAQTNAIPVPDKLGTPGRRNSRYRDNLGPIIAEVRQAPVAPTSAVAVTVTARILDSDGVASATVYSRRDGAAKWTATPLADGGRHGDGDGNDGLYGAILPGRPAATLVEFYIRAADRRGATQTFPPDAPCRTALYRVRGSAQQPTRIKTFDLLMTSATVARLYGRSIGEERMDNEFLDATLVMNNSRAFYSVGVRYQGSWYLRPSRGGWLFSRPPARPSFRVRLNADEKLLGYKAVDFDSQSTDPTCLHEKLYFWLAARFGGILTNAREYVTTFQNGRRIGVVEFVQPLDKRFLEDYFPGAADGELYETNDAFEWAGGKAGNGGHARFEYLGPDKERYRFNFEKRTHQKDDDFSSLVELMRALDRKETDDPHFEQAVEAAIDLDQWLRTIASLAVVSDWDGIAFVTGKNASLYRRPDTGRWIIIPWDKDLTWGNPRMEVLFRDRAGVYRLLAWPRYKRMYYSYMEQLLRGPFTRKQFDPVADSHHAMLVAEGEKFNDASSMRRFIDARREFLESKVIPKTVKFEVATRGGKDFVTSAGAVTVQGTAPLCVREIELNGQPAPIRWADATVWRIADVALKPGENRFAFVARPLPDGRETSRTLTITRK